MEMTAKELAAALGEQRKNADANVVAAASEQVASASAPIRRSPS